MIIEGHTRVWNSFLGEGWHSYQMSGATVRSQPLMCATSTDLSCSGLHWAAQQNNPSTEKIFATGIQIYQGQVDSQLVLGRAIHSTGPLGHARLVSPQVVWQHMLLSSAQLPWVHCANQSQQAARILWEKPKEIPFPTQRRGLPTCFFPLVDLSG